MGYRSEVAIAMRKTDYKEMLELAAQKYGEDHFVYEFIERGVSETECSEKEFMYLHWDYVKWYEGYLEVDFITNFLNDVDEYDFLRIGEDMDDTEFIQFCDQPLLGVLRKVDFS